MSLVGYAQAAAAVGVTSVLAAPEASPEDRAWLESAWPGADIHTFTAQGSDAFVRSRPLLRWLWANGGDCDVVHAHGLLNPISSLAVRLCVERGYPVVVRPFGTLSRYTFSYRRRALKRAYFRLLDGPNLRRATGVHFTTEAERREATWHGIDFDGRSYAIPPPWTRSAQPAARESDGMIALFLARLHPVKNLEALLVAWPRVLRAVPDATLVVAGDGEPRYVASLQALAQRLGVAPSVEFVGFVTGEQKSQILAAAKVFVLPSFHENFGIAVIEALAAGVPVVLTPEVQLADFVRDHGLGKVSDRTPASLADAIVAVFGDQLLRARCRTTGAALVARSFSSETIGEQLLEMYTGLAQATKPVRRRARGRLAPLF